MTGSKKQITFDLKQESLQKFYPKPENTKNARFYKKAYADIKRFMQKNGFQHRQYSVYISNEGMTNVDVVLLMQDLDTALPWFFQCVTEIDVTNIGTQHSLLRSIDDVAEDINVEL